ncbi:Resolvase, N terminal domain [Palleronia marisminoris]|uniref:Resolvase/invertase-type recombinase catalytic domain-containing protein n=1 Tax=Palleronia marisminoris TaxID=315423 RepID=A0A1Y5TTT5_9RHOB|nr:recombinase family protein [Palleronia marisminoris]SFH48732.1 Resolvase, N terminal domain [Palleronia marisminoris]SLN69518.1 hypothetical protein PAM7066_03516 [Palleronia marisminoris]
MIAALYLRSAVSDDDAIAEQHRVCAAHAVAQGWRIGEIFIDNGVSGVRDDRPGIEALRDCLQEGRASVVVAEDGARVCRDVVMLGEFYGFCDALGVEVSYARSSVSSFDLKQLLEMQRPSV